MQRWPSFITILLACCATAVAQQRLVFDQTFAPQEGLTNAVEKPFRDEVVLNGQWQFQPISTPTTFKPGSGDAPILTPPVDGQWAKALIRIPSPWNVNAFPYGPGKGLGPGGDFRCFPSYPVEWEKADMGWLRRTFAVPSAWQGKRILLHFEAVAGATDVVVNGKSVGSHFELFLPFELDITDAVKFGGDNELVVGVRRAELFAKQGAVGKREFVAGSMWGESIVGIWQDVYLDARPPIQVADAFVQPLVDSGTIEADVTLINTTGQPQSLEVGGDVRPWQKISADAADPKASLGDAVLTLPKQSITLAAGESQTVTLKADAKLLKTWSPEAPNLYGLIVALNQNGAPIDRHYTRFGYRQYKLTDHSLQLNGRDIVCRGDAWHFTGVPQMTRRYPAAWYQAIKDANGNCVRLHAQPYPRFYLDVADEMGLLVLDETGIWGSGGTPKFDSKEYWKSADAHLLTIIHRDRNHPAVMGYSVTNEVLVVMRNKRTPKEMTDLAFDYYRKWVNDIRTIDPTHPWISGDGEEDANGTLPTVIGHYGGLDAPKRWAAMNKPWGIGESGMAYYGTPKQVSEYNGPAAYESMAKRMEGVAVQAYELITQSQRPLNATYSSIFNIAWYALHPLPLGLHDTTRPPRLDDGVWFSPFVDGQPGMQPERIGPYCTTLNPGYDPSLPTYQPWPLFDAIKAANAPDSPSPSQWSKRTSGTVTPAPPPANVFNTATLLSAGKTTRIDLQLLGVPLAGAEAHGDLFIIDGAAPPAASDKPKIDQSLSDGGTVVVWRPRRDKLEALNALLPEPLQLTDRQSTSLLPSAGEQLTSGLTAADFYFTELKPDVILENGLAGPLVEHGRVALRACDVDWRVWNSQPEIIKTGSVARSEHEAKPGGAAIVVTPVGKGRLIVMNLAAMTATPQRVDVARQLLTNIGLKLLPPHDLISGGVFTNNGSLRKALIAGRFDGKSADELQATTHADLDDAAVKSPRVNTPAGKTKWSEASADPGSLLFDLTKLNLAGSNNNANAYVSLWINSPRSLDDVLAEPDVPHVDLLISGSEKSAAVWLNDKLLKEDAATASQAGAKQGFAALVLKRGWNHLFIKLFRRGGDWKFGAQLQSSDSAFMAELQAATEAPSGN